MPTFPTVHAAPYRYAPTNTSSRDQRNKMIKQNKSQAAPAPRPCDKTMSRGNTISVITPISRSCTIGKHKIKSEPKKYTHRERHTEGQRERKKRERRKRGRRRRAKEHKSKTWKRRGGRVDAKRINANGIGQECRTCSCCLMRMRVAIRGGKQLVQYKIALSRSPIATSRYHPELLALSAKYWIVG